MAANPNIDSPTVQPNLSYDGVLRPTLRGLDIKAAGVLFVKDIEGSTVSYDYTALTVPQRLVLQIRTIIGNGSGAVGDGVTGTNIALANLVGLH